MEWTFLCIAGVLEIVWAVALKSTKGFTRLWPGIGTGLAMAASYYFLSLALKTIPLGTGYAVWTGIGAAGTAIMGVWLFEEPRTAARLGCILLIVVGIAGLKLTAEP